MIAWIPASAGAVVVNEYMSSNSATIADVDGAYSDWIELYNPGPAPFSLTGCWLSDNAGQPLKWQFPQGSVPAGGRLVVWASDKNGVRGGGQLHTNFKLSADGEPVLLTAADGTTLLDQAPAVPLQADQSYARNPDGSSSWAVYAVATPGAPNGAPTTTAPTPEFSVAAGFHAEPFLLDLSTTDPLAQIRYTLDGSEPTATSALYTGPVTVDDRAGDPAIHALIPTNFMAPGHYAWRAPTGDIDKITVVRARAFRTGQEPGAIATRSFIVGPDVASRCFFPVISLVTDPVNLFDPAIGIYVPGNLYVPGVEETGNYFQSGSAWERPVHVELFDESGSVVLSQDAGVRISGNATVKLPQKSLKLYADNDYGDADFSAALFPDLPHVSYARFRVRNSGDDWGWLGFRDLAIHRVLEGLDFDLQAGRPVIQFLDGEYWGLANLRDEYSRFYYERQYGVDEDDVVLLENNGEVDDGPADGNLTYFALRDFVAAHDMNDPAAFAHADSLMDMANFSAYCAAEIFAANTDWPGNNITFWRKDVAAPVAGAPEGHDGRWRWSLKDMDDSFQSASYNALAAALATDGPAWPNPAWSTVLLRGLLENDGFRRDFINTACDQMNSTFRPARVAAIIDEHAAQYEPAIGAWYARWSLTEDWTARVEAFRDFANNRPAVARLHYQSRFGLAGTGTVQVDVNDVARGRVRVHGLEIDGDTPGLPVAGAPYPWSGTYFRGNPVTITALPGPGSVFVRWVETGETTAAIIVLPVNGTVTRTAEFAADGAAAVDPGGDLPTRVLLLAVAPNPFNPQTTLSFVLPIEATTSLEIFDLSGRRVRTLAAGTLAAGRHDLVWDGRDQAGRAAPSGSYLGRLRTGDVEALARMQLVR
ncbi:MAG: CotH kinase family protein [bacterium]|nr:CotH kinase family protein [bacterium]